MPGTEVNYSFDLSTRQVSQLVSASEGDKLGSRSECDKRHKRMQGPLGGLRTQCDPRAMELS